MKALDRAPPAEDDISKEFGIEDIETFKTPIGAVLESLSSIQLLNRYCMTLPGDMFTAAAVSWTQTKTDLGVVVKVRLPMQSTLKTEISVSTKCVYFF